MDSESDTYHFKIDGGDPVGDVLEAIEFVRARSALEIEPLGRVVDPEALESVITDANGVSVSFVIEGLQVELTSAGDIYINDPTPNSFIHESIGGASNVLLQTQSHEHEACVDLLSVAPYDEESLLGVLHADSFESRVSAWDRYMDAQPAETAAINVGDFPRSSTAASASAQTGRHRDPVSFVPDVSDLSELAETVTERLSLLAKTDGQVVVCFDSITDLLCDVPGEQAVGFLRTVTEQMEAADAVAHYHFDPEPFEAETESAIRSLFDSCVSVDGDGDWTVG